MEPTASTVEEMEKMEIEEALSLLASTRERCSEMLQATPRGHDLSLRCLEFLEKELSYIVACLTAMSLEHVNGETLEWAEKLTSTVSGDLSSALDEADPQRQYTLLRRAAQCFQRKDRQPNQLLSAVAELYRLAESPCRYNHLLTDVTLHGWREAADDYEDSGFNPVRFNWFEQRYYSFPYGTYLLVLYMVMFPYGHKFEKDGLLVKWLCETGMIDRFMGSEEDVFFSKLVHRSVITHAADNSRHIDADEAGTWQWNVNQLDHQFYASRSAEIGYVYTSTTLNSIAAAAADHSNEITRSQIQIARRLALYDHHPKILSLLQNLDLSQTRSLAVSGAVSIGSFPLEKFVNLVVLDVEGWENFKDEDLVRVCRGKMFFLVYLSIRNTQVTKLPPEIKELYSLQVLDASNTQVTELPMEIMEVRLRRLDLRGTPIRQLTESKQILRLHSCLETLLLGGEGMISSTETATRMPHDLC
ncbi:hypothetical protein HU200_048816 [Digitaria exilis]|uniref:Disease resistance R13L4/SHOC-2-like LRR domain-containing protein n=1 Tax=Digitaria exilis TaxID=1010633 RepID=A0A835AU94_9POAL|nr:hypothetical protein HU200_048816 [Digitaria exilis]